MIWPYVVGNLAAGAGLGLRQCAVPPGGLAAAQLLSRQAIQQHGDYRSRAVDLTCSWVAVRNSACETGHMGKMATTHLLCVHTFAPAWTARHALTETAACLDGRRLRKCWSGEPHCANLNMFSFLCASQLHGSPAFPEFKWAYLDGAQLAVRRMAPNATAVSCECATELTAGKVGSEGGTGRQTAC